MSSSHANALTARWAARLDDRQTVLSGAGVYPLLALLARYATGPARDELLAVAPDPTPYDLAGSPGTRLAVGFWSRRGLPLSQRWLREVPAPMRGELTGDQSVDQPVLDRWARERTDGLIPKMPVVASPGTAMVLASALTVLVGWARPFTEGWCQPAHGPWQGRRLLGLHRTGADLALRVVDSPTGPISLLTVTGDADVDVVLALGAPGRPASVVLPAAIGALTNGPSLPQPAGPGVTEQTVDAMDDRPELLVRTVGFTVDADHDLLERAGLFGLAAASDAAGDHFPGICPLLSVSQARQSARAEFSATGFRAAAVTGLGFMVGSAPPRHTMRKRQVRLDVDRPFGFLAVHRPTGLVLVAGWVTDPTPR